LFHGADGRFFKAFEFEVLPFGMVALDERNFIDAELHCFFNKPFDAIGIFGRRDSDVDVKIWRCLKFFFHNLKTTFA
jgi:hypothetical protein